MFNRGVKLAERNRFIEAVLEMIPPNTVFGWDGQKAEPNEEEKAGDQGEENKPQE